MPAVHAMELSQMLTQAMFTSESYLKQLPHCSASLLERCKEKVSFISLVIFKKKSNMIIEEGKQRAPLFSYLRVAKIYLP